MFFLGILIVIMGVLGIWFVFFNQPAPAPAPEPIDNSVPEIVDTLPIEEMPLPTLTTGNWLVNTISEQPVLAGTSLFATFSQDGRVTGNDGCNNFSGTYTVSGNQLTFDPNMISTKIACEPTIDQQATAFTTTLLATTRYELAGTMLMLFQVDTAGITMVDQGNSLAKTSWNVTSYNNGNQAVVSLVPETSITMTFSDDGTISGNSGCNSFTAQYNYTGSSITITQPASTMMFCEQPEGVMDQEAAFLAALQSASTWQMQGMELTFRTAEDALAVMALRSDL